MKNPPCGVCKGKTIRIPIPPREMGPYYSYWDGRETQIVGKVGEVPDPVLQKLHRLKIELVEVVPIQFGCTDKCYDQMDENGDPKPTIMTFWMRKDGREGDLWREIMERKHGHGNAVPDEIPGTLNEIVG
jgi:hypothetical protein